MANILLIPPTTSAATSVFLPSFAGKTVGVTCSFLGVNETLTLQVWDGGIVGAVTANNMFDPGWTNVVYNGASFECTNQNNLMIIFLDSLTYRVSKSVTAIPIGVYSISIQ